MSEKVKTGKGTALIRTSRPVTNIYCVTYWLHWNVREELGSKHLVPVDSRSERCILITWIRGSQVRIPVREYLASLVFKFVQSCVSRCLCDGLFTPPVKCYQVSKHMKGISAKVISRSVETRRMDEVGDYNSSEVQTVVLDSLRSWGRISLKAWKFVLVCLRWDVSEGKGLERDQHLGQAVLRTVDKTVPKPPIWSRPTFSNNCRTLGKKEVMKTNWHRVSGGSYAEEFRRV